jgi:hypothetical protein
MHTAASATAAVAACMRARVAAYVIDTMYMMYEPIYTSAQTQAWGGGVGVLYK